MVKTSFFVVLSLLEKCVLFSIISFHHLRSVSQSVSHLQLPLFSLIPLHCAFVSHSLSSSALFLFPYLLLPSSTITASLLEQMSLCLLPYPLHCHCVPVLIDLILCVEIGLLVFTWPLSEIP